MTGITRPSNETDDALASFYRVLWPEHEDTRLALFERDLAGRAVDEAFYDLASKAGVDRRSVVLDVGCGKGRQACAIAKKLGCRVVAVDPLEHCLRQARERARRDGVAELVDFRQGDLQQLPVADEEVDLVWCLDTFNHARDLSISFRQFARVLKGGGHIFNCSALETPTLEPGERAWLCRILSLNP